MSSTFYRILLWILSKIANGGLYHFEIIVTGTMADGLKWKITLFK